MTAQVVSDVQSDAFLKVESHGIDPIPGAERKGTARDVGLLWVAAFANFASLITGGLLISFGLGTLESILAVAVGSVASAVVHGLLSTAGPRFGATQVVAARRTFGMRGAYPGAFFTLFLAVGWFAVDCVIAAQALLQLGRLAGLPSGSLLSASARFVVAHCAENYTTSVPVEVLADSDVLIAYRHDGVELPADHGGPLRLVVPKKYAWKSAKWLERLEWVEHDRLGFWEVNGYNNGADPWKEERYW